MEILEKQFLSLNEKKNKPNFLVVGVPKGGTSSLYSYLKEHPDIFLPEQKELHFFSHNELQKNDKGPGDKLALSTVIKNPKEYASLYRNLNKETRSGDISPSYLYFSESVIPTIKNHLGDNIKIIIILRDPIGRTFSNYLHQKRLLFEDLSFSEALNQENTRKQKGFGDFWRYKEHSLYYQNCKNYIEAFGKENVKIILFEDLKKDAEREVESICEFLGVDSTFIPSNLDKVFNKGGVYKESPLTKLLLKPSGLKQILQKIVGENLANKYKAYKAKTLSKNTEEKPTITEETILELKEFFKSDLEQLKTINVDTSKWSHFK